MTEKHAEPRWSKHCWQLFYLQISLVIEGGQLKLTMETGNAGSISVSSIYIVNDGLQHVALVSFGVGFIQMQVDDDLVNLRRDENQPGLPQVDSSSK